MRKRTYYFSNIFNTEKKETAIIFFENKTEKPLESTIGLTQ
jgi:hypothetical protein